MLNSIIDTINPIQKEIPDSKKLIRLIGLIFSGMFIYLFVKRYHFIKYMITDFQEVLDFSLVFFLFPLIIILIGTIFFWKQKKTGWILLLIFMTYSATDAIIALSFVLRNPFEPSVLDSLFP